MNLYRDKFSESSFRVSGRAEINGREITYDVISEDNIVEISGEVVGSVFTYSYFRTDCENTAARPVIFAWNGGPCASCLWLHMGFLGPVRVVFPPDGFTSPVPPFKYESNPHWLLDSYDIVLMEPIGSGYGRLLNPAAADKVFGVDADANIFASVIHGWLEKYNRFSSPKYLLGESYGTVRAAVVSDVISGGLMTDSKKYYGINLDGAILMGSAIGTGNGLMNFPGVERALLDLPTMAALNHYHHPSNKPELHYFVEQAREFAERQYSAALLLGNRLPSHVRHAVTEQLAHFTGLSEAYIDSRPFLRLSVEDSKRMLLPGRQLDTNEGRFSMPESTTPSDPMSDNSAMAGYVPALVGLMESHVKETLGINFSRAYNVAYLGEDGGAPTDYKEISWRPAADCLTAVFRRNPSFRLMFISGLYDPATVAEGVRYLLAHTDWPNGCVIAKEYASGHMPYVIEEFAAHLERDIREFIG